MARQPDCVEGMALDLNGLVQPCDIQGRDPEVGDIYRSHSGQPALWWIVGHICGESHSTFLYIVFNMRGEIVGTSKAAGYYLAKRNRVGFMPIPLLQPEWINA